MPADRWNQDDAGRLNSVDQLVYRSNLLGRDSSVVNYGGGNTSIKVSGTDHTGAMTDILWVKGSGSNLATMDARGFTPLRLGDITRLDDREAMTDEEMVEYVSRSILDPTAPRPSIETVLHAFLPYPHVDHTHPQAAIAMCCSIGGEALTAECFGDELVWVPYVRPGFALAKIAKNALDAKPQASGMLLAKHGLVTWGQNGQESYQRTIDILRRAEDFLEARVEAKSVFGGTAATYVSETARRAAMLDLLPRLRGALSRVAGGRRFILDWDDTDEVLEFVNSWRVSDLALTGAACPDHVMYTKFRPLVAHEAMSGKDIADAVGAYVNSYTDWFGRNGDAETDMLDPAPRVLLLPGLGMVTAGSDVWAARNTGSLYRTAIRVMRWAEAAGGYTSLSEKEAWDIEYWPLELYKLTLKPPPREMAGRVAVITGGAGAIGSATARRLLAEDAHVVLNDLDERSMTRVMEDVTTVPGRATVVGGDAGSEWDVERLVEDAILAYGGIDIVIPNAGIASSGVIQETSVEQWDTVHAVLLRGYFLACRAAFRAFEQQGLGGNIVINASKNGLAAGKDAIAYTTAKAAELHMARCLAEEGGPIGIRVNAVAPDAVIQGSGIWSEEWKRDRAHAYGFEVEDLEEFYRKRNALKVAVTAADVAEAILFLASDRSAKTTGCVITVDGGLAAAYPR